jgi:hypothetical protein
VLPDPGDSLSVVHLVTATVPCRHDGDSYRRSVSKHYLILIEQLVREGHSEREIDRIVRQAVNEDVDVLDAELDEPAEPEQLRAA